MKFNTKQKFVFRIVLLAVFFIGNLSFFYSSKAMYVSNNTDKEKTVLAEYTAEEKPIKFYKKYNLGIIEDSYLINSENYVSIRNIASLLTKAGKPTNVSWNNSSNQIEVIKGQEYIDNVNIKTKHLNVAKAKEVKNSKIYIQNEGYRKVKIYNINDNNYLRLKDLSEILDFYTLWDKDSKIVFLFLEDPKNTFVTSEDVSIRNISKIRDTLSSNIFFNDEYQELIDKDLVTDAFEYFHDRSNIGIQKTKVDKLEVVKLLVDLEKYMPFNDVNIFFHNQVLQGFHGVGGYYQYANIGSDCRRRLDIYTIYKIDVTSVLLHEIGHQFYFDNIYETELFDEYKAIYPEASIEGVLKESEWSNSLDECFAEDFKIVMGKKLGINTNEVTRKETNQEFKEEIVTDFINKVINHHIN